MNKQVALNAAYKVLGKEEAERLRRSKGIARLIDWAGLECFRKLDITSEEAKTIHAAIKFLDEGGSIR